MPENKNFESRNQSNSENLSPNTTEFGILKEENLAQFEDASTQHKAKRATAIEERKYKLLNLQISSNPEMQNRLKQAKTPIERTIITTDFLLKTPNSPDEEAIRRARPQILKSARQNNLPTNTEFINLATERFIANQISGDLLIKNAVQDFCSTNATTENIENCFQTTEEHFENSYQEDSQIGENIYITKPVYDLQKLQKTLNPFLQENQNSNNVNEELQKLSLNWKATKALSQSSSLALVETQFRQTHPNTNTSAATEAIENYIIQSNDPLLAGLKRYYLEYKTIQSQKQKNKSNQNESTEQNKEEPQPTRLEPETAEKMAAEITSSSKNMENTYIVVEESTENKEIQSINGHIEYLGIKFNYKIEYNPKAENPEYKIALIDPDTKEIRNFTTETFEELTIHTLPKALKTAFFDHIWTQLAKKETLPPEIKKTITDDFINEIAQINFKNFQEIKQFFQNLNDFLQNPETAARFDSPQEKTQWLATYLNLQNQQGKDNFKQRLLSNRIQTFKDLE